MVVNDENIPEERPERISREVQASVECTHVGVQVPFEGISLVSSGVQAVAPDVEPVPDVDGDEQLRTTLERLDEAVSKLGFDIDTREALPAYIQNSKVSLQSSGSPLGVHDLYSIRHITILLVIIAVQGL